GLVAEAVREGAGGDLRPAGDADPAGAGPPGAQGAGQRGGEQPQPPHRDAARRALVHRYPATAAAAVSARTGSASRLPTAAATRCSWGASAAKCCGVSDWGPSESASSGRG